MAHRHQCLYDPYLDFPATEHTTMKNYYNIYNDGDDNENEDGNDHGNADYGSGSYGPIFHLINIPWCCRGGSGNYFHVTEATAHYISTLLNMCHKLLYV